MAFDAKAITALLVGDQQKDVGTCIVHEQLCVPV
jgi:hypothetical protein